MYEVSDNPLVNICKLVTALPERTVAVGAAVMHPKTFLFISSIFSIICPVYTMVDGMKAFKCYSTGDNPDLVVSNMIHTNILYVHTPSSLV